MITHNPWQKKGACQLQISLSTIAPLARFFVRHNKEEESVDCDMIDYSHTFIYKCCLRINREHKDIAKTIHHRKGNYKITLQYLYCILSQTVK